MAEAVDRETEDRDSVASIRDDLGNYADTLPIYIVDLNGARRRVGEIEGRDGCVVITLGDRV